MSPKRKRMVHISIFIAALLSLASLVFAVRLGMDDASLAWGMFAGWVMGFFSVANWLFDE